MTGAQASSLADVCILATETVALQSGERYWLTGDASQDEGTVLQAEHIQTGTSMRAASLVELEPWFLEICRSVLAKRKFYGR